MSLSLVVGKTGSGKSLFAVHKVVEHFLRGDPRPVVTNLTIYPDRLDDYLRSKGVTQVWRDV